MTSLKCFFSITFDFFDDVLKLDVCDVNAFGERCSKTLVLTSKFKCPSTTSAMDHPPTNPPNRPLPLISYPIRQPAR